MLYGEMFVVDWSYQLRYDAVDKDLQNQRTITKVFLQKFMQ